MLVAPVRPVETQSAEITGDSLEHLHAQLAAMTPEGFELTDAPAHSVKGSTELECTATFKRFDGVTTIEADDIAALRAKITAGWQMLIVRRLG